MWNLEKQKKRSLYLQKSWIFKTNCLCIIKIFLIMLILFEKKVFGGCNKPNICYWRWTAERGVRVAEVREKWHEARGWFWLVRRSFCESGGTGGQFAGLVVREWWLGGHSANLEALFQGSWRLYAHSPNVCRKNYRTKKIIDYNRTRWKDEKVTSQLTGITRYY